ncbi:metalloregulator ArsR/SmtB family transcription factor [Oscillospiraceae bacterium MB08-C2-2]|nr:metalloregulator ArsR/SmtB family transcription factor [Oscillospiraceae bacterium MB08-C2-2]
MNRTIVLKSIADETRMKILTLLLQHNYCVRALANKLELTEATISQHLKVLREAGLLVGEKRGYFMHYDVERSVLHELASEIEALAAVERESCTPQKGGCNPSENARCHVKSECGDDTKEFCHGIKNSEGEKHHGDCQCHKS